MDVYTFRRTDPFREQVVENGGRPTRCALNFIANSRNHIITLSTELVQKLKLKLGAHVAFAYDESKPSTVFIRTADYADDEPDVQIPLSRTGRDYTTLRCYSKVVVRHVLEQVGARKACTCFVAQKPTVINGKDHYQIMVSCPIMTK